MTESKSAIKKWIAFSVLIHIAVLAYFHFHMLKAVPETHEQVREIPVGVSNPAPAKAQKAAPVTGGEMNPAAVPIAENHAVSAGSPVKKENYLGELRQFIESKKIYPATAKTLGETGRVDIHFILKKNGEIKDVSIKKPCASQKLNRAAQGLVSGIGSFRPFPEELKEDQIEVDLPVIYELH